MVLIVPVDGESFCSSRLHFMHYDNTPIQYIVIFHGCKNDNTQMKNCYIFLSFLLKTLTVGTR